MQLLQLQLQVVVVIAVAAVCCRCSERGRCLSLHHADRRPQYIAVNSACIIDAAA